MNPDNNPENMEEFSEEIEMDDMTSIDDFIKELEAREKDLHISDETVIEIEDDEYDDIKTEAANIESADEIYSGIEPGGPDEPMAGKIEKKPQREIAPPDAVNKTKVFELEREVEKLKESVAKTEAARDEVFELSRRRQTDFDNFKKRTERDKNYTFSTQLGNLAVGILPVLDNLDRAMDAASNIEHKKSPDFQQFFDGIVLVNQQLNEVLSEMGVKPIGAIGEVFDPHFHEAVATEETEDFEANMVLDELLRGYLLGEKVIRPSMVKVSKSAPAGTPDSEPVQNDKP